MIETGKIRLPVSGRNVNASQPGTAKEEDMTIYNNGYVHVAKEHTYEFVRVFAKHNLLPDNTAHEEICDQCYLNFDENKYLGDIEDDLRAAVEELSYLNIYPEGVITYYGDYEGRYEIGNGQVQTLSHEECIVHDMTDEEIVEEARRRGLCVTDKEKDEQSAEEWRTIKKDGTPPVGACLIVTIKNHGYGGRRELRYPVYYLERTYEPGYGFYFGDLSNTFLPEYSEVVAWMPMPRQYEGEV